MTRRLVRVAPAAALLSACGGTPAPAPAPTPVPTPQLSGPALHPLRPGTSTFTLSAVGPVGAEDLQRARDILPRVQSAAVVLRSEPMPVELVMVR